MRQGASIVCSAFPTLGQSGEPMSHLGMEYNLLDKIARIIFITRQEIPRNIDLSPFLMWVSIDCTAQKLMPTSLAMLRRSRLLSHITRVCTTLTFSSVAVSLGRSDRP